MSESKNNKNENSPFTQKPFSSDVWERAYKNVGRPFEKQAFETLPKKDTDNEAPASAKLTDLTSEERRRLIEEKKARLGKIEVSTPSKPTEAPAQRSNNTTSANSSETYYSRFKDYHVDEESEPENVVDMIKGVFGGIFGGLSDKIKEALDIEDSDDKKVLNIIWGVIAIIFFIIIGLLGGM